jgi:hypothetical protein
VLCSEIGPQGGFLALFKFQHPSTYKNILEFEEYEVNFYNFLNRGYKFAAFAGDEHVVAIYKKKNVQLYFAELINYSNDEGNIEKTLQLPQNEKDKILFSKQTENYLILIDTNRFIYSMI